MDAWRLLCYEMQAVIDVAYKLERGVSPYYHGTPGTWLPDVSARREKLLRDIMAERLLWATGAPGRPQAPRPWRP